MHYIGIQQGINQITTIFYRFGMWHREDETNSLKTGRKLFFLIFYASFAMSLLFGAFFSNDPNETIFLADLGIGASVYVVKLAYILWKEDEILAFVRDIGTLSVADSDEYIKINVKVKSFMKFAFGFTITMIVASIFVVTVLPFISNEKSLPLNIGFPMDWKNSTTAYWIAFIFLAVSGVINIFTVFLTVLVWYLMMMCSMKYQILGSQFRNIGAVHTTKRAIRKKKIAEEEKQNLFFKELIGLIEGHKNIQETIDRFKSCFSTLFFAQIITSGICICAAVYVLAFSFRDNVIQTGIYCAVLICNFFDIFMVMYFGNEIKLSSDRLSYDLFQSNWMDQTESCKKCIIILSEVLQQPHELVIGILYPLDLETFSSILNLAYSMFNILQNFN